MARKVNLNADMGESFGAWHMGDDDALLAVVRSANVACGFHAGDPVVMRRLAEGAARHGVSIGAHPAFPDLQGFGRRRMDLDVGEIEALVAYQTGALRGMAAFAGLEVTHVKAHGALYNLAAADQAVALAIGRAIRTAGPSLIWLGLPGSAMERAAATLSLRFAAEAFADRAYEDDGSLTPRSQPGAVIHGEAAVERGVRMVLDQEIVSRSGRRIPTRIDSLCVHGDTADAVSLARAIRSRLEAAGVEIVTLPELFS